jgi:hypothetical protein
MGILFLFMFEKKNKNILFKICIIYYIKFFLINNNKIKWEF